MPFAGGPRRNPLAELLAVSQPDPSMGVAEPRPKKARKPRTSPFAVPPPPEPVVEPEEEWDMRDYAAMGVRGLGGMLGIGAAPGAAFGAGSEALANVIEGDSLTDPQTLKDIAASGVIGASGGGIAKMVGAGAGALQALLRGGALSGGAEAVSEYVRGQELDPGAIGMSAALGGGAAGATSALLKRLGINTPPAGKAPASAKPTFELEQTPTYLSKVKGKVDKSELGSGPLRKTMTGTGEPIRVAPQTGGIDLSQEVGAYPDAGGLSPRASRAITAADKATAEAEKLRLAKAQMAGATEGKVPKESVTESFEVPAPGGKRRMTRKFVEPSDEVDEVADEGLGALASQFGLGARTPQVLSDLATPPPQALGDVLGVAQPISREAAAMDDITAQLVDEGPGFEERRILPRSPEEDRYFSALRAGASEEDAIMAKMGIGAPISELQARPAPPNPEAEAVAARTAAMMAEAPLSPLDELLGIPQGSLPVRPAQPPAPQQGQPSMQEITKLFGLMTDTPNTTPGLAAGANYRKMKGLFETGTTGMSPEAEAAFKRPVLGKGVGRKASQLAEAEGIPPGPPRPQAQAEPPVRPGIMSRLMGERGGATPPADPQIAALKQRYEAIQNPIARERFTQGLPPEQWQALQASLGTRPGLKAEGGFIDPSMAASLGLGLFGALGGAAWNPLEDRMLSALAGGVAGAAIPQLASKIASAGSMIQGRTDLPEEAQTIVQQMSSPEGAARGVMDIVRLLPAIQRGMLLTNQNIFNNALAAPYGSAVTFGLERALSGDARGWEVLRQMRPDIFADNFKNSWDEAAHLIGDAERAGGPLVGAAGSHVEKAAALPGTFMAGGDLAARKAIMAAGFTEDEARMATLTSEPESKFGKGLVNWQRTGGPLAQMALPFARTIVNLGEQGMRRLPGVGYIAQGMRENADPIGVQHIQQLLGGGSLLAGYGLGDQMEDLGGAIDIPFLPDDKASNTRLLRSLLSNISGPNATLMTMGMAAGRAGGLNKDPLQQVGAAAKAGIQEAPLPTAAPFEDIADFLTAEPGQRRIPRSMAPGIVRDELNELLFGTGSQASGGRRKTRRTSSREER